MSTEKKCGTCIYHGVDDSVCRRYPPQVASFVTTDRDLDTIETTLVDARPSMAPEDWCGEWQGLVDLSETKSYGAE